MSYELYTYPNCENCSDVKSFLKDRKIEIPEHNLTLIAEKRKFTPYFQQIKDKLEKDDHGAIMPILLRLGPKGELEEFLQGPEKIKTNFIK